MYCRNCGKEVHEKAVACPACGVPPRIENKFCNNCGTKTNSNQILCVKCGTNFSTVSNMPSFNSINTSGIIKGIVILVVAFLLYFFMKAHNPNMGFGEMMNHFGGWVFKEPIYEALMVIDVLIVLLGFWIIYKSFHETRIDAENSKKSLFWW